MKQRALVAYVEGCYRPRFAKALHYMKRILLFLALMPVINTQAQTAVEAWARRYSNLIDSDDEALVVKTDSAGNIYVAGNTYEGVSGADALLIKYSTAGVALWTNRYDGPGHRDDVPAGLAVDGNNDVIVAMHSHGSGGYEFATIKYSSAGVPLWTNRYHGPGVGNDYVHGLAVDGSGNVFVSGESHDLGTSVDYAVIKYSSAGAGLWTNRYDGPIHGDDYPWGGLALDADGNVFLTGTSESVNSFESTTICYTSGGALAWVNRHHGPDDTDEGDSIAVTGTNVFVAGRSRNPDGDVDFVTLAFSTSGVPLWTNRYDGPDNLSDFPSAMAVTGNSVFVTGVSTGTGTGYDYTTIAYSITGLPLWTNRYNGPGNGSDWPAAMTVDNLGNVFVAGYSIGSGSGADYATVALSSAGTVLWTQRYGHLSNAQDGPKSIATDGDGNVYVTGGSFSATTLDWATIKYLANGSAAWTNRYNGVGKGYGRAAAVAVDESGNIIVTGDSASSSDGNDYLTIKYSSTGTALWTNRHSGSGNLRDYAYDIAVDLSGNTYVVGYSASPVTDTDYAIIKYSDNGTPVWTNHYDVANHGDEARAVEVDGSANVFVTGYSHSGTSYDYATIKYSSAGVPQWTNRYDGPANWSDRAHALALDASGNVIVAGHSYSGPSYDYATIKYSNAGVPLWTNRYDGPAQKYDEVRAITVDKMGNVIVTGYSDSYASPDYATIKYSSAGVPLWTNRYDATYNDDEAQAVAVDAGGNVYVTGFSHSGTSYDYVTIKYSSAGLPMWTNRYDGPVNGNDQARAVVVDGNGTVVVTGSSVGADSKEDFATIAYSSAGSALWTNRYNGPFNSSDAPFTSRSIAVTDIGSFVVVGASAGGYPGGGGDEFFTLKYVTAPLLNIQRTTTNTVVVSWPSPSTDFQLQQNTNDVASVDWSNVTTAPIDNGTNKTFIVNPPTSSRFFRLIYP